MPSRPNLSQALGREAVYGPTPSTTDAPRRPGRPKKTDGPTWEESHERATFHLARDLHQAVKEEAARSGRTKSAVVSDALREHLAKQRPAPKRPTVSR
jgi:hypothetical protein